MLTSVLLGSRSFAALALAGAAPLQQAPAPTPAAPRLVIEALDGRVTTRPIEGLSVERLAELGAACVRFEGLTAVPASVPAGERALVRMVGGNRVTARVAGGAGDVLKLDLGHGPESAQRFEVDVDRLESIVFDARVAAGQRGLLQAAPQGDRLLWLRPAGIDRVDGTLEAFGAESVRFESVLGSREFAWGDIAALFIEPVGEPKVAPVAEASRRVVVELADGGRLHGALTRLSAGAVELVRDDARPLTLPLAAVEELCVDDGSLRFLSDLEPARAVEGWPSGDDLGMKWRYQLDRAVTGEPLRAGGATWRRGIGVHSPSRLEWELDGGWTALRGHVAIDESVLLLPSRGSVEFKIYLGDGSEPAWSSARVQGGSAPLAIPTLDLSGARKLALEVTMDDQLYVADRADWLRVVLLRGER